LKVLKEKENVSKAIRVLMLLLLLMLLSQIVDGIISFSFFSEFYMMKISICFLF